MNSEIERKIDNVLQEAYDEHERNQQRQINYVLAEIDRTRLDLIDLLTNHAKQDNTISKARIHTLLGELDEIERKIRDNGLKALDTVIDDTATKAIQTGVAALGLLAVVKALSSRRERQLARNVVDSVFGRFKDENIIDLSDRMWTLAGDYNAELRRVLQAGIIQGKSVNQLVSDVRKVYEAETWKIETIVITETNTAHRVGIAKVAEASEVVKAIKIIDHPGHKRHDQHECYRLARQNPYGWGDGVYRPQDTYIYSPHPRCRASFRYVLKDEYLKGNV